MNEQERQRLLDSTQRKSGTIGEEIPETVTIRGSEVDLREFVFECKRLEAVPDEERERIEEMERKLKRERLARKQRIADEDITYEEGERLVDVIRGLDRAINALEGLDSPSLSEELRRKRLRDAEELLSLVEQAT